jgi:hypothetical protein
LSQQADHVFGIDAIFFAAEVSKCDRWLRCHAVIVSVALFDNVLWYHTISKIASYPSEFHQFPIHH